MLDHFVHQAPANCVLIHGAGGTNLIWRGAVRELAGTGRAFAVNLPGHPSGDITCKTVHEYAASVGGFIAEIGVERPVVCGHSMGSAIALQLAIDHPESVGGLILVGAGAKLGVDPKIVEGLRTAPMKTIEETITPMSYFKIDVGLGREARAALSFSNLPVFLNDYLACDGFDVRRQLPSIGARTLVVCGEDDRMTPPKWSEFLAKNMQAASLELVQGAGHMLPLEKPAVTGKILQDFLLKLSR
ncbi:MAG: alpha/beta hydrolase [archaeon]|nr:MAG: alpha/beta hydrolase [archaeon]